MYIWTVSDTDARDFPKNNDDLDSRLKEIAALIPQPLKKIKGNNVEFAQKAFTLLKDCGLITEDIIKALNDPFWCERTFNMKMNPLGGVLRQEGLPMYDSGLRYYTKHMVICKGVPYCISNDWFSDDKPRPTKRAFFCWLSVIINIVWRQRT